MSDSLNSLKRGSLGIYGKQNFEANRRDNGCQLPRVAEGAKKRGEVIVKHMT